VSLVVYEKKNRLVIVTMNRPDRLNAIDIEMMVGLREAWVRYRDDEDAWIAILTGAGRAFTAGADKSWFVKSLQGEDSLNIFQDAISKDPYWSGSLDKPVIVAVNGLAVGAGLDLTLRADLRLAAESATFQQLEVERGNVIIFYDNLPCAMAAEMMSGFRITAQRAYEVGMINRVVPNDKLMDAALEMGEELLTRTPLALYHALKILRDMKNSAAIVPRRLIDHYTTMLSKDLMKTEDFKSATSALLEKKKPIFKKR
jgi:enoyl-CoA hydratase/carnithine racemase